MREVEEINFFMKLKKNKVDSLNLQPNEKIEGCESGNVLKSFGNK